MKNLVTIAYVAIAMCYFAGCSKKPGTSPVTKVSIEGKWIEDSAKFVQYKNSQVQGTSNEPAPDGSYLQFNVDGTGAYYEPATQTQTGSYPAITVNITYTLSESTLSLNYPAYQAGGESYDPYTDVWTVLSLNEHQLALKYTDAGVSGTDPANALIQYFYYSR